MMFQEISVEVRTETLTVKAVQCATRVLSSLSAPRSLILYCAERGGAPAFGQRVLQCHCVVRAMQILKRAISIWTLNLFLSNHKCSYTAMVFLKGKEINAISAIDEIKLYQLHFEFIGSVVFYYISATCFLNIPIKQHK